MGADPLQPLPARGGHRKTSLSLLENVKQSHACWRKKGVKHCPCFFFFLSFHLQTASPADSCVSLEGFIKIPALTREE